MHMLGSLSRKVYWIGRNLDLRVVMFLSALLLLQHNEIIFYGGKSYDEMIYLEKKTVLCGNVNWSLFDP